MTDCSQMASEMALAVIQVFDIGSVYGALVFGVGAVVGWCVCYLVMATGGSRERCR